MASDANWRLRDAARDGDVAGIAAALLAGADANNASEGTAELTPLLWAAFYGHVAAIAALLAAGARVDGTGSVGITPLMNAALNGGIAAIDALLAAGADVHRVAMNGNTALHLTSSYSRVDAARVLLDAGARTDVRDKRGKRPIDVVRAPPLARFMRLLRDRDAPLQRRVPLCRRA
jgi:uncharacterized protein